jgi:hypothetical protein
MENLLLKVAQTVFVSILLILLAASVKKNAQQVEGAKCVAYPWSLRIFSMIGVGAVCWMVLDVLSGAPEATVTDWKVPLLLASLMLPLLVETFGRRVFFDELTLKVESPWTGTRSIRLSDITRVCHSEVMQWHELPVAGQRSIRLSDLLSGKDELLEALKRSDP